MLRYLLPLFFMILFSGCFSPKTQDEFSGRFISSHFKGVKNLQVNGAFCQVSITGKASGSAWFEGRLSGSANLRNMAIRHERRGDLLKVWVEAPSFTLGLSSGELIFEVPAGCNIQASTGSGSIFVSDIKHGEMILSSTSGSIRAENVQTNARLTSSSGSIKVTDHRGDLELKSASGSQNGHNLTGNIIAESSSGSLHFTRLESAMNASTSSGSIYMEDFKGSLHLESSSGSIAGKNVVLTSESSFKSGSGAIDIDLLNDFSELAFQLSASSGSITLEGKRISNNFVSHSGAIRIRGSSGSGNQRYY